MLEVVALPHASAAFTAYVYVTSPDEGTVKSFDEMLLVGVLSTPVPPGGVCRKFTPLVPTSGLVLIEIRTW